MHAFLLAVHVILAIGIIALVLIQHGKGADAGAAFGSGASATVFGAKGAGSVLTRATTFAAICFFITSLTLAYLSARQPQDTSLIDQLDQQAAVQESVEQAVPAVPAEVEAASQSPADVPTPSGE